MTLHQSRIDKRLNESNSTFLLDKPQGEEAQTQIAL